MATFRASPSRQAQLMFWSESPPAPPTKAQPRAKRTLGRKPARDPNSRQECPSPEEILRLAEEIRLARKGPTEEWPPPVEIRRWNPRNQIDRRQLSD